MVLPRSLSQDNNGTHGITVDTLQKNLDDGAGKRESDRNRKHKSKQDGKSSGIVWKSVPTVEGSNILSTRSVSNITCQLINTTRFLYHGPRNQSWNWKFNRCFNVCTHQPTTGHRERHPCHQLAVEVNDPRPQNSPKND